MSKKKRQSHEEHAGNHERWLLTYADMITLLMIFFIIMYSMSIVDAKKFASLAQSLNGVLDSGNSIMKDSTGIVPDAPPMQTYKSVESQQLDDVVEKVSSLIKDSELGAELSVVKASTGITIRVKDNLLFDSGSARIRPESFQTLDTIVALISKLNNRIRIEGYTDNVPISSVEFHSNWELASQRAINVATFFASHGVAPERLSAESFGEFRPLVPNTDSESRKKNRRVDIVIIRDVPLSESTSEK